MDRGHTKDNVTLPVRLIEDEVTVNGKSVRVGWDTWAKLRDEYYRYRGWSAEGVPNLVIAQ